LVLLKNVTDKNQFLYLACQVFPEDSDGLYRAYLDATRKTRGYLLLDLSQDTDDRFRFRSRIFPNESPIIYAAIGGETHKVELSLFKYSEQPIQKYVKLSFQTVSRNL